MLNVYKKNSSYVALQQLYSAQEEQLETLDKDSQQLDTHHFCFSFTKRDRSTGKLKLE